MIIEALRMKAGGQPLEVGRGFVPRHIEGPIYENRVAQMLMDKYGPAHVEYGPWFQYRAENELRWRVCQPDFVIHDVNFITGPRFIVVECKRTFKAAALWKLHDLYLPVVSAAMGTKAVYGLQICSIYKNQQRKKFESSEGNPADCDVMKWP